MYYGSEDLESEVAGSGLPPKNFLIFLSQKVGKLPYLAVNPFQHQLRDPH